MPRVFKADNTRLLVFYTVSKMGCNDINFLGKFFELLEDVLNVA